MPIYDTSPYHHFKSGSGLMPKFTRLVLTYLWPVLASGLERMHLDVTKITTLVDSTLTILTGLSAVWSYLKPWLIGSFVYSVITRNEHNTVNLVREWIT